MCFKYIRQFKFKSSVNEYFEALIWAVVLSLIIRTWGVQAFKIPSGSMKPTLLIGDHLLVNKFCYGLKMPFIDKTMISFASPRRGDVIVFRFPEDRKKDFIKRVIALPGETVEVQGRIIYINGKIIDDPWGSYSNSIVFSSSTVSFSRDNYGPVIVPGDSYFVMGDNRDLSYDSRFWFDGSGGFVSTNDIVGKAFIIYWSWDEELFKVRWSRLLQLIF